MSLRARLRFLEFRRIALISPQVSGANCCVKPERIGPHTAQQFAPQLLVSLTDADNLLRLLAIPRIVANTDLGHGAHELVGITGLPTGKTMRSLQQLHVV